MTPVPALLVALVSMVGLLQACSPGDESPAVPATLPEELSQLRVGEDDREYFVHVPDTTRPDAGWPLVLVIHGLGSSASEMRELTGFDQVADRESFVAVYPDGLARAWLDAGVGGLFADTDIATRNLQFVEALIDELDRDVGVDQNRIYMTGLSNGGMFAFHTACNMSDRIAAVGLVAAASISQSFDSCQPVEPVSYIAFHGTADNVVPYDGGPIVPGIDQLGEFQSAHVAASFWAEFNGCQQQPTGEQLPDTIAGDGSTAFRESWAPCSSGTGVELITLDGAGHTWPGHRRSSGPLGATNLDIDATELLWDFFDAHPKTD